VNIAPAFEQKVEIVETSTLSADSITTRLASCAVASPVASARRETPSKAVA
jgi:hypothetical protein